MFDNDLKELVETDIWTLYQHGVDYNNLRNMYDNTDRNNEFYNGDQWKHAKLGNNPPLQLNYIKTIVKTKVSTINQNLWKIVYDNMNFDNEEIIREGKKVSKLLNKKAEITWERNKMDGKIRKIVRKAGINSESVLYNFWYDKTKDIRTEILSKNDIIFGDENTPEIEEQPYIIVKKRMTILKAKEYAKSVGCPEDRIEFIIGDADNLEEAGEKTKDEKDNKVTVLTEFWKEKGTVYYRQGTRYCVINEKENTGYTRYPVQHYLWEEKEGDSRGVGEVEQHIENQLEVNRTLMRRSIVGKNTAYPHPIVNTEVVQNVDALKKPGATIKISGKNVQDVKDAIGFTNTTQMSSDIKELMNQLITLDKELAGAGDAATGNINPSSASGRAILAMQEAANQPMIEQQSALKDFIEEIALCWLDMWIAHADYSIKIIDEEINDQTGDSSYVVNEIPIVLIQNMNPTVKIEITAKGAYDKYAKEQSLENLANSNLFLPQNAQMLEDYVECLDDDSNMPKATLLRLIKKRKERQNRIAQMKANGQLMQQQVQQFLNEQQNQEMANMMQSQSQQIVNQ